MKKWLACCMVLVLLFPLSTAFAGVQPPDSSNSASRALGYVLCESLTICREPNGPMIGTLKFGDIFEAGEIQGDWIACNQEGWVRRAYVAIDPPVYTAESNVPVYAYPQPDAPRVALLEKGEMLPILWEIEGWAVVSLRGASGWLQNVSAKSQTVIVPMPSSSESAFSLKDLAGLSKAALHFKDRPSILLTDGGKLWQLSALLSSAEYRGPMMAGCPFDAELEVVGQTGKTTRLQLATDSCCIFRVEGADYAYARNLFDPQEGSPDNQVLFQLFGIENIFDLLYR